MQHRALSEFLIADAYDWRLPLVVFVPHYRCASFYIDLYGYGYGYVYNIYICIPGTCLYFGTIRSYIN